jgi:hypothetical protein
MACNCIATQEAAMTSSMTTLNAGSEVVESVSFQTKQYDVALDDYKMYAPITGRYRVAGRVHKFDSRIILTYCPICGVAY